MQEALTNAVKHGDAERAAVEVVEHDRDGAGCASATTGRALTRRRPTGGFGLIGMRERVELLDGELHDRIGPRQRDGSGVAPCGAGGQESTERRADSSATVSPYALLAALGCAMAGRDRTEAAPMPIITSARSRSDQTALSTTDATPITVVLADDHQVVRSGLRLLLESEPRFEVLAEAGDVADDDERGRGLPTPGAGARPQHGR